MVPSFFQFLLPPTVADVSNYQLRNNNNYTVPNCRLTTSSKSFIPSTTRLWNSLDEITRNSHSLPTFKTAIAQRNTNKVHCLEYLGNRKFNIIHARLRHNCSILNYDLFRCNIVEDPSCRCGNPCENVFHFFMECPLYSQARDSLFNDTVATSNVNLNTFLFGNALLSLDDNSIIFKAVQRYIRDSGRF